MVLPVLKTKTVAPPLRSELVRRKRLFELLNKSKQSRLILVNAPAGYGKSTVISAWAQVSKLKGAWFTIDRGIMSYHFF
jgi:LuxR family maltose regulon positive regulatory protein